MIDLSYLHPSSFHIRSYNSMARFIAAMLFLLVSSLSAQPASGSEVVQKMYDQYKGRWYTDLTFTQQSIFYKDGKVDREEIWHEAIKMPKGLVIKFGSKDSANGLVFMNDTQYVFRSNVIVQRTRRIHDLLLLGFEVYFKDPAESGRKLQELGFDMSRCTVETGPEGKHYVVGDSAHGQFWITADTYIFTKLRKKDARENVSEVQFNKYQKLGGGWVAPEVIIMRNGQVVMKELYSDWMIDRPIPDSIFDLSTFQSARW